MDFEKTMIFFMPGGFRSGKTQGCFLFWKTFHYYSSIKFVYFSAKKLYDYTPKQIKLDYFIFVLLAKKYEWKGEDGEFLHITSLYVPHFQSGG